MYLCACCARMRVSVCVCVSAVCERVWQPLHCLQTADGRLKLFIDHISSYRCIALAHKYIFCLAISDKTFTFKTHPHSKTNKYTCICIYKTIASIKTMPLSLACLSSGVLRVSRGFVRRLRSPHNIIWRQLVLPLVNL